MDSSLHIHVQAMTILRITALPEHLNSVTPFSHGSPLVTRKRVQHSQSMRSLAIRYLDCHIQLHWIWSIPNSSETPEDVAGVCNYYF